MNNEKQGAPWTPEEEERSNAKAWGGEWTPADESRLMAGKWWREQHRTDYELLNPEQRVGFIQTLIKQRKGVINDFEMDLLLNQLKVARRQEQVAREALAPAPPQPSPQDSGAEDAQGRQEPPEDAQSTDTEPSQSRRSNTSETNAYQELLERTLTERNSAGRPLNWKRVLDSLKHHLEEGDSLEIKGGQIQLRIAVGTEDEEVITRTVSTFKKDLSQYRQKLLKITITK
jgi:hypothetical protein